MRRLFHTGLSRLRVRLAAIIAIALAPAGVLAIVQAVEAVETASRTQLGIIEARSLAAVDARRAALVEIREKSRVAAINLQRELATDRTCEDSLAELDETSPGITISVVFDEFGKAICGADQSISVAERDGWQTFSENPRYMLAAARTGQVTGNQVLLAYRPLQGPDGEALALGSGVSVNFLRGISPVDGDDLNLTVHSTMIDRSGTSVETDEGEALAWLPEDRSKLQSYGDRTLDLADRTGTTNTYFISAISPGQLWAVTSIQAPNLWSVIFTASSLSIIAPILIWIIAIGVAYFAIDTLVTRHVASLRRAAVRIGDGDLDTPVGRFDEAPTEIKELGASVRAMRDKIFDREAELRSTLDLQHRLLLEVHHRVKNNLQTISSMINLESGRIRDESGRALMDTIQSRIHSLAMVHQNLYAAESLEEVALDQLTRDIAEHLEDSLGPTNQTSITSLDLDDVTAPPVLATPVALFLSEALGNAFKHAPKPADIRIELHRGEDEFSVKISNRLPTTTTEDNGMNGLGFQLMKGFAKQISGSFKQVTKDDRFEVHLTSPLASANSLFSVRTKKAS